MPDNFMPDVQVEIAFNAGYTTPDASRTWTDVSAYVELAKGIGIDVGRQDERSTAGANSLTLTLDNSDGRFTAGRAASPYYPNVKIGRPIRVTATPPGGSASRRFVGFIDEWPVEWEGSDAYASATIKASSRLARLGLSARLLSLIEEATLAASPFAYYTLGEPSTATRASDSSGAGAGQLGPYNPSGTLIIPPVFGDATGPGTDDLTALRYPAGSNPNAYPLRGPIASEVKSLVVAVTLPASGSGTLFLVESGRPSAGNYLDVFVTSGNIVTARWITPSTTTSVTSSALAAGSYDIAATCSAADGLKLYVNGSLVDSDTGADLGSLEYLNLGGDMIREVVFSHFAAYSQVLTSTQVADRAAAVSNGYAGDLTSTRLARVLEWAGIAAAEVNAETGVESMTYQKTTGQSVVDVLREIEATESGVLFDGRDGRVTFHNRSRRYLTTAAATLNMASQHVGADFSPKLDRSTLTNDVTVSNPTTEETARATSATSADEYGIATSSATSVASTYDPLFQKASWMIASYAEPRARVSSLTVDVLAHQGLTPSAQTLLALDVGSLLVVTNAPTQADSTSQSYFIEGYTESIGPEKYEITFNLSPTYPTLSTFVLNDATRGKIDAANVLAF